MFTSKHLIYPECVSNGVFFWLSFSFGSQRKEFPCPASDCNQSSLQYVCMFKCMNALALRVSATDIALVNVSSHCEAPSGLLGQSFQPMLPQPLRNRCELFCLGLMEASMLVLLFILMYTFQVIIVCLFWKARREKCFICLPQDPLPNTS